MLFSWTTILILSFFSLLALCAEDYYKVRTFSVYEMKELETLS